ncbi:MAG: hypothetical protein ACRD2I_19535 [Vicinamibacterales bacterium]
MQYMLRAAQQSARAQDLYYAVLHRVALGTLTPTAIRDTLASFSADYGPTYAAQVGQLAMQFLGGLLQAIGNADDPAPPYDAVNPTTWFVRLSEYANSNSRRAVHDYQINLGRVAAGDVTPPELQADLAHDYSRRSTEQLRRMSQLYFDLLRSLSELTARAEDEYFSRLLGAGARAAAPEASFQLGGALGEHASALLTIENTRTEAATIRCVMTELRRADGIGPAFMPSAIIDPARLVLEAGQESTVRVSLQLDPSHFEPGVRHVGAVQVLRGGDDRLEIPLQVTASPVRQPAGSTR